MEENILKSDIFFFITTICVLVLSILVAILLVYGVRIFRDLRQLVSKAKEEGEAIIEDSKEIRTNLKKKSVSFASILASIFSKKRKKKE